MDVTRDALLLSGALLAAAWLKTHIATWGRFMPNIILPPPTDPSWKRARAIVDAFRARGKFNPLIVGAVSNAYAESAWRPDVVGDHGQSFGPWQMKFKFYGQPILAAAGIDIRNEPYLARHVDAVLFALSMPANVATLAALESAKTGADATRIWAAQFERASAGGAVERRVAISGKIETWLAGLT